MDAIVVDMDLAGVVALRAHLDHVGAVLGEAAVDDVLCMELVAGLWGAPREVEVEGEEGEWAHAGRGCWHGRSYWWSWWCCGSCI